MTRARWYPTGESVIVPSATTTPNPSTDNMLSLVKTSTPSSAEYIAFRGQPYGLQVDQPEVPNFKELSIPCRSSFGPLWPAISS